jgi:hypothetical protein
MTRCGFDERNLRSGIPWVMFGWLVPGGLAAFSDLVR